MHHLLDLFYRRWVHNTYIYKLDKDYHYNSKIKGYKYCNKWVEIHVDGLIIVKAGYAWDGCTPKVNLFDLYIFGAPEGILDINTMKPKTYYASLVHDVLYQFYGRHGIKRKRIDSLFYDILRRDGFYMADAYYMIVDHLGAKFFNKYDIVIDDNGDEWIPDRVCDE